MPLFFPRIQEFSPIFRLAEELDRASRQELTHCSPSHSPARSFAPRFDVKETDEAYELNGELPGIDQSNINIEWADDTTLTVSGSSERHVEKTNASEVTEAKEATPEASEAEEWTDVNSEHTGHYRKPSVEDEATEETDAEKADSSKEVAKAEPEKAVAQPAPPQPRYWVSERSYGSFKRTFKFHSRVEHDAVKASLKNGVLSVVVPKAKPLEPRKITIN
jgi:HSP20 family molecular chaperone IbpA